MSLDWVFDNLRNKGALTTNFDGWRPIPKDLHPIFTENSWNTGHFVPDNVAERVHDRMERTLSLATNFITVHSCLDWWCTLMNGRIRKIRRRGNPTVEIFDPTEPTWDALEGVRDAFNYLVSKVSFEWRVLESDNCARNVPPDNNGNILIEFNTRYLDYFVTLEEDPELTGIELDQFLRVSYELARTMVHELAHSFFTTRALATGYDLDPHDFPRHSLEEPAAEHGFSWESWLFGGISNHINRRFDCAYGLALEEWLLMPQLWLNISKGENIAEAIHMDYIRDIFTVEFWSDVVLQGKDILVPKLTGVSAQTDLMDLDNDLEKYRVMKYLVDSVRGCYGPEKASDAMRIVLEMDRLREEESTRVRQSQSYMRSLV
jgi:hypothetical protein